MNMSKIRVYQPSNEFLSACELYGPQDAHNIIRLWRSFLLSIVGKGYSENQITALCIAHVMDSD